MDVSGQRRETARCRRKAVDTILRVKSSAGRSKAGDAAVKRTAAKAVAPSGASALRWTGRTRQSSLDAGSRATTESSGRVPRKVARAGLRLSRRDRRACCGCARTAWTKSPRSTASMFLAARADVVFDVEDLLRSDAATRPPRARRARRAARASCRPDRPRTGARNSLRAFGRCRALAAAMIRRAPPTSSRGAAAGSSARTHRGAGARSKRSCRRCEGETPTFFNELGRLARVVREGRHDDEDRRRGSLAPSRRRRNSTSTSSRSRRTTSRSPRSALGASSPKGERGASCSRSRTSSAARSAAGRSSAKRRRCSATVGSAAGRARARRGVPAGSGTEGRAHRRCGSRSRWPRARSRALKSAVRAPPGPHAPPARSTIARHSGYLPSTFTGSCP